MTFCNTSSRPKTLMELLLAKKIEAASAEGGASSRRLFRTDSMDSVSSIGSCTSSMLGEDVCRCDDCLLGIVDLYIIAPRERTSFKKKVTETMTAKLFIRLQKNCSFDFSSFIETNLINKPFYCCLLFSIVIKFNISWKLFNFDSKKFTLNFWPPIQPSRSKKKLWNVSGKDYTCMILLVTLIEMFASFNMKLD